MLFFFPFPFNPFYNLTYRWKKQRSVNHEARGGRVDRMLKCDARCHSASGLDEDIFYDLGGNHDCFGVPEIGGKYDFCQKYSMNSRLRRHGNVQSVTLQVS